MIDKLEMLIALAREGHFSRAAEACHVTQPTLSSGIKALEEQLGAQLVNRGPRYIGLTPEGERVLARARVIVAEARALRADVSEAKAALSGVLRLGVIPTALIETRAYTAPFLARHPGVSLTVASMTSHQIVTALADFGIDAGISYAQPDLAHDRLAGMEALPLYDEHYALLTPEAPGLPKSLRWQEVAEFDLGLLTPDMQNRRIINRNLAAAEVKVVPRIESNSILTLVTHVAESKVSTILPERIASFFAAQPGLVAVPIRDASIHAGRSAVALLLPPQGRRSSLLESFVSEAILNRKTK
jgi:DNA-binding transcriptional LysR family regulator